MIHDLLKNFFQVFYSPKAKQMSANPSNLCVLKRYHFSFCFCLCLRSSRKPLLIACKLNMNSRAGIAGLSNEERSMIEGRTWSSAAFKGKKKAPPNAYGASSHPTVAGKPGPQNPKRPAHPTERLCKEQQSNWTQVEISTLIQAKHEKFSDDLENQHEPNLMRRENTQWSQISAWVIEICGKLIECNRDSSACKDKWSTLLVDYKKVFDCHKASGSSSYWTMSSQQHIELQLP